MSECFAGGVCKPDRWGRLRRIYRDDLPGGISVSERLQAVPRCKLGVRDEWGFLLAASKEKGEDKESGEREHS